MVACPMSDLGSSSAVPEEVVVPIVFAWMKETDDPVRFQQPAGQIWSLVRIAVEAAPGEVGLDGGSAMLLRDDVVDLKRQVRECFRELTVFATAVSPVDDELMQLGVHQGTRCFSS